jgi:large subunit ribosomal protein L18
MTGLRTQKRRRRECKTDYKGRLSLLKSGVDRIVIRQTNKYFIVQLVTSEESKDKVLLSATSKDLIKEGLNEKFTGSLKSVTAGYLTGILFANKADKKGKYIIDLGMTRNFYGNRNYSVVKGLIDGGLKINANEKIFPSEDRLAGKHLKPEVKKEFDKVLSKIGGNKK